MSGGGGTSGKISFPSYVERIHENILDPDGSVDSNIVAVDTAMADAHTSNPFSGTSAPSTSQLSQTVDTWYREVKSQVDQLDTEGDLSSAVDVAKQESLKALKEVAPSDLVQQARSKAGEEILEAVDKSLDVANGEVIEDLVDEFEQRVNDRLVGRKRRFSSVFADANAVHSSAFVIGHAILERDAQREVNRFDAENTKELFQQAVQVHVEAYAQSLQAYLESELSNKQASDQFISNVGQQVYQSYRRDIELLLSERRARQEVSATDWEARQSQEEYEIKLDQRAQLWELQVLKQGSNILAAPSGLAATLPEEPSDASKAIGGALTGGVAGAKAGSKAGPTGTAVGAGLGALLGAASGFLE